MWRLRASPRYLMLNSVLDVVNVIFVMYSIFLLGYFIRERFK